MILNNPTTFYNNIDVLLKKYPAFKNDILEKYPINKEIIYSKAQNGLPTAKINNIWIHSSRQPEKEAEKLIKHCIEDTTDVCFVFGFGLGYHIEEILKKYSEMEIIIIEPEPELFLSACKIKDIRKILNSDKVGFLLDATIEYFQNILVNYQSKKVQIFKLNSLFSRNTEYYKNIEEIITNFKVKKETNKNTLNRFGKVWIKNLFRNIEVLTKSADCGLWFEKFLGQPALIVAAGPSLDKLLPILPELSKRMIIICVDTALRSILEKEVIPDFIIVVDPQYLNSRHLDGLLSLNILKEKSILISESSTHPLVFKNCILPVYFFKSVFPLGKVFDKCAGIESSIGAGGSVSTTAWDFARLIGCTQIYSIGIDLSYPFGKMHCKNSLSSFIMNLLSNRINPTETQNFRGIRNFAPFKIINNQGGYTLTDKRLIIYSWWFKSQAETAKNIKCYNLSKFGMKIEGIEYLKPELLKLFPKNRIKIDKTKKKILSIKKKQNPEKDILKSILEIKMECKRISKLCNKALKITDKLQNSLSQDEVKIMLQKLSSIDKQITKSELKELTGFIIQPILNEIAKDNTANIDNSKKLYTQLQKSCKFHIKHANRAIMRFDKNQY